MQRRQVRDWLIGVLSRWLQGRPRAGIVWGDLNGVNPRVYIHGGTEILPTHGGRTVKISWHRPRGSHRWTFTQGARHHYEFTEDVKRCYDANS